jgi:hypothetical protein
MGRIFGFVALLAVVGTGAYVFMHQAQSVTGANGNPGSTVEMIAVERDIMNVARAERNYVASHGNCVAFAELHSSGELSIDSPNRGPYNYSVDCGSGTSFRAVATYSGPDGSSLPKAVSVDETMHMSQQ